MATQTKSEATERVALPGKFVWFEHASDDARAAQEFYRDVLGWKTEAWQGSDYEMILAGDTVDTMVGGYTHLGAGEKPRWRSYVSVDDVDAAAARAAQRGGRVVDAPEDIPGVGRSARVADAQGAELFLFRSDGGDPADTPADQPPPARTLFWCELHTTEPAAAVGFYEHVVGYTHETMDMGPAGSYHILNSAGGGRAGVAGLSPEDAAGPHWLPYVAVDDVDATLERAARRGGRVLDGPHDIPDIGRFGVLADPTGAVLAVMKAIPAKGAV